MKFSRDLKKVESRAPPVFKGSFVNYDALKKFLKFRGKQLGLISNQTPAYYEALKRSDAEFLRMLANQLREVDRRFEMETKAVIAAFDKMKMKRRSFWAHRDPADSKIDPEAAIALAERAAWCQEYARTNAQSLRKIAKKHDKAFKVKTGQQFVQACWRGDIAVQNFLSAPMLSELAAVEELLRSKGAAGDAADFTSSTDGFSGSMFTGSETGRESGFKCAICLDILYLPVALECGHVFCGRCVVATAVGHEGTQGNIDSLLASGPVGCSKAPCPQCRATEHGTSGRGVFYNAKRLPHMDQLIMERFPEDWKRRREEDEQEQGELRASRVPHGLFSFFHRNSLQKASPAVSGGHPANSGANSHPSHG